MTTPATAREIAKNLYVGCGCCSDKEDESINTAMIQEALDAAVRAALSIVDGTLASAIEAERDPHTCNVLEGLRQEFAALRAPEA